MPYNRSAESRQLLCLAIAQSHDCFTLSDETQRGHQHRGQSQVAIETGVYDDREIMLFPVSVVNP